MTARIALPGVSVPRNWNEMLMNERERGFSKQVYDTYLVLLIDDRQSKAEACGGYCLVGGSQPSL